MEIAEEFLSIEQLSSENSPNTNSSNFLDPKAHNGAFVRSEMVKH